ncbi:MAG: hypothetical protein K6A68_06825, partial [Clostridiales bacterium]|nr:hypothetical protein [Clostridiales bacterium]
MSHRRPTQKHCIYHQTARWAVIPTGVLSDKTPYPAINRKQPFFQHLYMIVLSSSDSNSIVR